MRLTPTPTRLTSASLLPILRAQAPSLAAAMRPPRRSAPSRGPTVLTTGRNKRPARLAATSPAGESSSSKGVADDDDDGSGGNRGATAAVPTSSSSSCSSSSSSDAPSSDADRRARLPQVLTSTASSTSSASEAYASLSRAGFPPSEAAAASALIEAALAAGNASLALDVFRAMVAPPLPLGGLLNSTINNNSSSRGGGGGNIGGSGNAGNVNGGGGIVASWPRPTPGVAAALAVAMARSLRPSDAEAVLEAVRGRGPFLAGAGGGQQQHQGVAAVGEVPFGFVVPSPALSLSLGAAAGSAGALANPPSPLSAADDEAEQRSSSGSSASSAAAAASARPPLAVVQPHEGVRTVACPSCRYRLELFSGTVSRAASSPAASRGGFFSSVASFVLKRPPAAAAVHELDVVTPSGVSRPFRFGTAGGDAPAAVGERVTVVCSPSSPPTSSSSSAAPASAAAAVAGWRKGILSPSPPGTRPGQPLLVANHATGLAQDALDPPAADSNSGSSSSASASALFPPWAGPLVLLAVAGDAASALADPSLPLALAAAAAGAAAAAAAGRSVVLPALRRLPESSVGIEASHSELLAQHVALTRAADEALAKAAGDARALARLWALRAKMGAVSAAVRASSASASPFDDGDSDGSFVSDGDEYAERGGRVEAAAAALERRLAKAVELLDG